MKLIVSAAPFRCMRSSRGGGVAVRTALVYDGALSKSLEVSDSVDIFVSAQELLNVSRHE